MRPAGTARLQVHVELVTFPVAELEVERSGGELAGTRVVGHCASQRVQSAMTVRHAIPEFVAWRVAGL